MPESQVDAATLSPVKLALLELQTLRARLHALEQAQTQPIAIVGMALRFPGGANDPESFWRLLHNGVDAIIDTPPDRWDVDAYYDPDPDAPGKMYSRGGGFLTGIDQFDPQFFGISPREATSMDPRQRLLLEVSWEALEHACQSPDQLKGSATGVYIGIAGSHEFLSLLADGTSEVDTDTYTYSTTGSNIAVAAGRLAYVLGLQGPAVALDTACSSSLLAVHLACQSLRAGECTMALAGGVNLILAPHGSVMLCKTKAVSFTDRCQTFDAAADGYVRGEGCGMVVLKRLADALANRDTILAVIRGSAANQDGRSNGLTAPNGPAQENVMRKALADAKLAPAQVDYVETHGTGTSLGDPIEVQALAAVYGEGRPADRPLAIGSVKTNFGHLESAAGVAGLIKAVLALQQREIPPHLHLQQPTPHIPWDEVPIIVPTKQTPWPATDHPPVAAVSSFGFSGTNVHMILEAAPEPAAGPDEAASQVERPLHLLTLSAKNRAALLEVAGRYGRYLSEQAPAFPDVCYTANTGRAQFNHRLTVLAESSAEAREKLAAVAADQIQPGVFLHERETTGSPEVAFLFTGQGAQYVGMGRMLYQTQPTFRQVLDECDTLLRPYLDRPLLAVLFGQGAETAGLLEQTAYTQPALFALEYALAKLWQSWGIEPAAVMGHSVGEYVAACLAGVFSLEEGLRLIAERGHLMQALPTGGSMAAVFAPEADIAPALAPYAASLSIAAYNGPDNTVLSGEQGALEALLGELAERGIKSRPLAVSHAFHSPLMAPMLDQFEQIAGQVDYRQPQIPLISNLTGGFLPSTQAPDAAYWRRHVREPVRFSAGIENLHAQGYTLYLEVGPAPVLLGMARRCLPEGAAVTLLPSLRQGRDDWQQMLESLAQLYLQGVEVDWQAFEQPYPRRRLHLPTYPFQRQRYWPSIRRREVHQLSGRRVKHPLLGRRLDIASTETIFESRLSADAPGFLGDHRVFDSVVVPATAYMEMALAAARRGLGAKPLRLEEMEIYQALLIPEDESRTVQVLVSPEATGGAAFRILSLLPGEEQPGRDEDKDEGEDSAPTWLLHATGRFSVEQAVPESPEPLAAIQQRCRQELAGGLDYEQLSRWGVEFGPSFRGVQQLWQSDRAGEALGLIQLPEPTAATLESYQFHPALLDACLQAAFALKAAAAPDAKPDVYLPVQLEMLRFYRRPTARLWSHAQFRPTTGVDEEVLTGDFRIYDDSGEVVAELVGLHVKRANPETLRRAGQRAGQESLDDWLYEVVWRAQPYAAETLARTAEPGAWLIFTDGQGVGAALTQRLQEYGASTVLVVPGAGCAPADGIAGDGAKAAWRVDPAEPAHFEQLLAAALPEDASAWRGIVHLWSLDTPPVDELDAGQLHQVQALTCGSVLHLVQALGNSNRSSSPLLCLVTRGAQSVQPAMGVEAAQASLWGLGQTIGLEYPGLACLRIDLDPASTADPGPLLFAELWAPDGEDQIALRGDQRYVARLVRRAANTRPQPSSQQPPEPVSPEHRPVRLEITTRGALDNLILQPAERRRPGPGEVESRVRATGLNFRDVLKALGLYPGEPGPFGDECAGEIVAVGPGVKQFKVGDRVFGLAAGTFATYVTTRADFLVAIPDALTFEEAATVPIVYLTAYYALHHLAKIQPGERVLIHAAAGGVGMAAVQLAQRAGAVIFGTAGNPEKRDYLKSIGVDYVMDSRSLDYADQILAATQGEGVDIVLNSLNGDFIPKNLSVLKENGRYLEIGKIGIWDAQQVAAVKPGVAYYPIFLGEQVEQEPALVQEMLQTLVEALAAGQLKPLPRHLFALTAASQAFRFMAQAKHIGKIVLTQPSGPEAEDAVTIRPDATYLVTGGLGGLGLVVARWLVARGARHLVLMGRRGAATETARQAVSELEEMGAQVVVAQADVSDAAEVARTLDAIVHEMPPLRGLIHAAGVVDDGMLQQQNWARFERVMAPKVMGAWHLHRLTQEQPLDFFVLFSSGAALLGSPGQGNYAAANSFLDMLAHHRRSQGLSALSINWGPWAEVGMSAALNSQHQQRWANMGLGSVTPEQGAQLLDQLVGSDAAQVGVLPIHWPAYLRSTGEQRQPPLLQEMAAQVQLHRRQYPSPATTVTQDILQTLAQAHQDERREILLSFIREQARLVLGLAPGHSIHDQQPLGEYGLDSLMAVELRTRLAGQLGVALSVAELLQGHSLSHIAASLLAQLQAEGSPGPVDEPAPQPAATQEWEVLTL